MEAAPLYLWLVAGIFFFIAEALGASGFGLLFSGFGALTVGLLINLSLVPADDFVLQFVVFFIATTAWSFLLYNPIKKWRDGKGKAAYNNMLGQVAAVAEGGMSRKDGGNVKWSGTIMKAKFANNCPADRLEEGEQVIIKEIVGNSLIVTAKE